ncbi:MAG: F0F1 ATP synthase subunit epsilon [Xanthobacteraceae bacterium]|nr:F0F1 ATP synthase subunit epsilon [Xanthobacteraceae bacterium]
MATFQFNLVSPEKLLLSGPVDQVDVPGSEGDFGVLAGHAPFVATLRPGILTVHREGGSMRIVVSGGFAEVSDAGLTVLADIAVPVEDVSRESFAGFVQEAEEAAAKAPEGVQRDKLSLRAAQLKELQATLAT